MSALLAAALAQGVVVVLMIVAIIAHHVVGRRGEHRRSEREALVALALRELLLGATADGLVATLRSLPRRHALEALLDQVPTRVPATRLPEIAEALRSEPWVRSTLGGARSRRWGRRLEAARLLEVVASPANEPLVAALIDDRHPAVRAAAVRALAGVGSAHLVRHVLSRFARALAEQPDALWQLDTAALRRVWQHVAAAATSMLDADGDPASLRSALHALRAFGAQGAVTRVLELRAHSDSAVRRDVATLLACVYHHEVGAALLELAGDPDADVRAAAAGAMGAQGQLGDTNAVVGALHQMLGDAAWQVRVQAGLSLARLGAPGRAALRGARDHHDSVVRDAAILASGLPDGALAELSVAA
ncbi:MAG TPA: HEAT repeat domain-containing protein [Gemmatimonadales bacterium]